MMTQTDTGKAMLKLAYDRNGRDIAERSQVGAQRDSRAAFIFDPAAVWSSTLARLLGTTADGVTVSREDIAEALRLASLKLSAGDSEFVMTTLVGQASVLQRLTEEAAREMQETERVDFKAKRVANYLALHRAHMRVLSAIATMQAKAPKQS